MTFTVIIPVYNVEAYLRDCLDSVIAQTFGDWEAVCVDDGSTDRSAEILAEYAVKEPRFKVVSQPNGGLSAARNTGLSAAQGEYVLFLDSDDWLEPNAMETIAQALSDEDMICFSGRRYFEETKTFHPTDQLVEKTYSSGMEYYNENALLHRDFAFVCVVLRAYRRSFLSENGLRFKEGLFHEDNLFTPMACCYASKVRQMADCLYDYRVRPNSITDGSIAKRLKDMLMIANELAEFFREQSGFDKTTVYRAITHHYQRVFSEASQAQVKELKQICHWNLYRMVSRTKLRHRWNYLKNRYV